MVRPPNGRLGGVFPRVRVGMEQLRGVAEREVRTVAIEVALVGPAGLQHGAIGEHHCTHVLLGLTHGRSVHVGR